jgi:Cellulase (glycosyl hydrolase family 5)/Glycoside hydrolase family 5 C-terminal domain
MSERDDNARAAALAPLTRVSFGERAFRDQQGRDLILRGVNFGGDSKVPFSPAQPTYLPTDFADHRTVSFVGRPAPLDEIDSHFARMRRWGFNCLRLLTTWEAVEHAGPGEYDEAYLDYYAEVCRRAGAHGLYVLVDFHQDAWARMSGGDGAPGWTFEAAGLDFTRFHASGAAHVMQHAYDPLLGGRQDSYPVMSWSGNYARPANGVMWTLFFAGRDLAPDAKVAGVHLQDMFQDHYLGAMQALAARLVDMDHVLGFDTLNEPGAGYVGKGLSDPIVRYRGPIWSALDGLALLSGLTRTLPVVAPGQGICGETRLNTDGVSVWLPGREDPFRAAGVWDIREDQAVALKEDHFKLRSGHPIDVGRDCMAPFFHRVAGAVRALRPDWLLFAEVDPFEAFMGHGFPDECPPNTVNASHWYDLTTLVTKTFDLKGKHVLTGEPRDTRAAIERNYVAEMSRIRAAGDRLEGGAPTLLGECGIPFDMNDAQAYRRWAEGERGPQLWEAQTSALDMMYNAIDQLGLSSTQWNYTASNRNDPMIGDGWNQEDLSIWSADQATTPGDPDAGGRAVEGFCRPFVRAAQGRLVRQSFDRESGVFEARIAVRATATGPTEIYVPSVQYPNGYDFAVSGGQVVRNDAQIVSIVADGETLVVRVTRR